MNSNKQQEQNIATIVKLLDVYGIATLEAKATFLALAFSFCQCIPKIKDYEYTTFEQLKTDYPKTFGNREPTQCVKWLFFQSNGGDAKSFYDYVYDVNMDGEDVGNVYSDDGYKFADCGLIPIVGRSQFERLQDLVEKEYRNCLESSSALISNLEACVNVAALVFRERMGDVPPNSHPQFFYEACSRFPNIVDDQTKKWYEHFYGAPLLETFGYNNKVAGNEIVPNTYYGSDVRDTYYGFTDPNGKYPYNRKNGTSRYSDLAKGRFANSIVSEKENKRRIAIPCADGTKWDQPHSQYNAVYPYNTVKETESGHYEEWDDTPGHERIHFYHRAGTFSEIDQNGTKVTRIVGDNYTITDRNGFISIDGNASVTVNGNVNVYCLSDANVKVEGSAKMEIGGSVDVGVAKDFRLACQGDVEMWANGTFNIGSTQSMHIKSKSNIYTTSEKAMHLSSGDTFNASSKKDMDFASAETLRCGAGVDVNVRAENDIKITSGNNTHLKSANSQHFDTGGDQYFKIGGDFRQNVNGDVSQYFKRNWKTTVALTTDLLSKASLTIQSAIVHFSADANMNISSGQDTMIHSGYWFGVTADHLASITSGGIVAIDSDPSWMISLNGGMSTPTVAALTAKEANDVEYKGAAAAEYASYATKAIQKGLNPPPKGCAVYPAIKPFLSVAPRGEYEYMIEEADQFETLEAANDFNRLIAEQGEMLKFEGTQTEMVDNNIAFESNALHNAIMNADPTTFNSNYKISEHFTLGMMFDSGFNIKHKLRPQGGLSVNQIVANLSNLANNVLEKALEFLPGGISGYRKQWTITSGYRQGYGNSDHIRGRACDIQIFGRDKQQHWDLATKLQSFVGYDQIFLEYRGKYSVWVHIGYRDTDDQTQNVCNRKIAKTYVDDRPYCDGFKLLARC